MGPFIRVVVAGIKKYFIDETFSWLSILGVAFNLFGIIPGLASSEFLWWGSLGSLLLITAAIRTRDIMVISLQVLVLIGKLLGVVVLFKVFPVTNVFRTFLFSIITLILSLSIYFQGKGMNLSVRLDISLKISRILSIIFVCIGYSLPGAKSGLVFLFTGAVVIAWLCRYQQTLPPVSLINRRRTFCEPLLNKMFFLFAVVIAVATLEALFPILSLKTLDVHLLRILVVVCLVMIFLCICCMRIYEKVGPTVRIRESYGNNMRFTAWITTLIMTLGALHD